MAAALNERCDRSHGHDLLEGRKFTKPAEGYPFIPAVTMAQVMVEPEIEDTCAAEDSTQSDEGAKPERPDSSWEAHQHARLREQYDTEALRYVKRLHRNMGHPSPA
eukprot:5756274-Pyramimonas_sp.AAC.1